MSYVNGNNNNNISPIFGEPEDYITERENKDLTEWEQQILTSKNVLLPHSPFSVVHIRELRSVFAGNLISELNSNNSAESEKNKENKPILEIKKWKLVSCELSKSLHDPNQLMNALCRINPNKNAQKFFDGIPDFFKYFASAHPQLCEEFFNSTVHFMTSLALELPKVFQDRSIPKLIIGESNSITLSRREVAILLANAFFCTYVDYQFFKDGENVHEFPKFNFYDNFWRTRDGYYWPHEGAKLIAIINYFRKIQKEIEETGSLKGNISYTRRSLTELPQWKNSTRKLSSITLETSSETLIEDVRDNALKVDFANKSVGGGVLSGGCVQEEIMFAMCPEMIVSLLFTAVLADSEVLMINGARQYSKYKGYGKALEFDGDFDDPTHLDADHNVKSYVVAMDAIRFFGVMEQYMEENILRELDKCYAGFFVDEFSPIGLKIVTGNWGCGVFRGDKQLKSLMQIMAACELERTHILYTTFHDKIFETELKEMFQFLASKKVTVGKLYQLISKFGDENTVEAKLFDFLRSEVNSWMFWLKSWKN